MQTTSGGGSAARSLAFRYLWLGRFVSLIGTGAAAVALQVTVVDAGGASAVAGLFLALAVPQMAGSLIARAVANRDACAVMVGADLVQAFLVGLLALFLPTGPMLYVLLVAVGVSSAVFYISGRTLLRELLDQRELSSGIAWLAFAGNAQNSLGPVLAALLLTVAGPRTALAIDACTFLLSAACLLAARRARTARPAEAAGDDAEAACRDAKPRIRVDEPTAYLHQGRPAAVDASLRLAVSTGALGSFAGAILNVALVVRLRQDLAFSGQAYGGALAAFGAGTVLASPVYQQMTSLAAVTRLRLALIGVGLCCVLLASLSEFLWIGAILLLAGAFQAMAGIARENIVQDRDLPRVGPAGGSLTAYTSAGLVVGFLVAGPLTGVLGADGALAAAAVVLVAAATAGRRKVLNRKRSAQEASQEGT